MSLTARSNQLVVRSLLQFWVASAVRNTRPSVELVCGDPKCNLRIRPSEECVQVGGEFRHMRCFHKLVEEYPKAFGLEEFSPQAVSKLIKEEPNRFFPLLYNLKKPPVFEGQ